MPNPRNGRSKGRFCKLEDVMIKSVAWKSLNGNSCRIYIELLRRYNGRNNGSITMSIREAVDLFGMGKGTVLRCLAELQEKGFIERTERGQFTGGKASTWLLTTRDNDLTGHHASMKYRQWKPEK